MSKEQTLLTAAQALTTEELTALRDALSEVIKERNEAARAALEARLIPMTVSELVAYFEPQTIRLDITSGNGSPVLSTGPPIGQGSWPTPGWW